MVLARGGLSLQGLQDFCVKQQPGFCLTARYQVGGRRFLGTAIEAFLADLRAAADSTNATSPDGLFEPLLPDPLWTAYRDPSFASGLSPTPPGTVSNAPAKPEPPRGSMAHTDLRRVLDSLGGMTRSTTSQRLVLFCEVVLPDDPSRRWLQDWRRELASVLSILPPSMGLVLSGLPDVTELPDSAAAVEIVVPPDTDATGAEQGFRYVDSGLAGDRPAERDDLQVARYAEGFARLIHHPQTQPITIAVHGPWGKGKSSFLRFVDDALVTWSPANRAAWEPGTKSGLSQRGQTPAAGLSALDQMAADLDRRMAEDAAQGLFGNEILPTPGQIPSAANQRLIAERQGLVTERGEMWDAMRRLAESDVIAAWFDAWQYEDSKQIWAGLASSVSRRLERAMPWHRRAWARVWYTLRNRLPELVLSVLLPAATAVLLAVVIGALGAKPSGAGNDLTFSGILSKTALPVGVVALLVLVWRLYKVVQPVSVRVLQYTRLPDYRDQMGYQHQVLDDIKFISGQARKPRWGRNEKQPRVIIFIDNLDRCGEDKIMEMLQAINLILGESDFFVFLGIDTEMIYRAIKAHYKAQAGQPVSDDFARSYLRKIIQLNFYLPPTAPAQRDAFVGSLFSAAARAQADRDAGGDQILLADDAQGPTGEVAFPYDRTSLRRPIEVQWKEVEDTPEEVVAFRTFQEFLDDNPRDVKRMVNLHRLLKIMLQRQNAQPRPERARKLVKWLVFCERWPALAQPVLQYAASHPQASDTLSEALTGIGRTGLQALGLEPADQEQATRFATYLTEHPGDLLSSKDLTVDEDFTLAANLSQLTKVPS
jgi:KAP family P-loop domain